MNKVKEIGVVEEKEKIGIGSLWRCEDVYHVLAQVGCGEVCLIGLDDGNRKVNPIIVNKIDNISSIEWDTIIGISNVKDITRVHAIEIRSEDD